MFNILTVEEVKKQAQILKEYMKAVGFDISHCSCLNAVAKMNGFKNWNMIKAVIETEAQERAEMET